jgi:hypothetical protein
MTRRVLSDISAQESSRVKATCRPSSLRAAGQQRQWLMGRLLNGIFRQVFGSRSQLSFRHVFPFSEGRTLVRKGSVNLNAAMGEFGGIETTLDISEHNAIPYNFTILRSYVTCDSDMNNLDNASGSKTSLVQDWLLYCFLLFNYDSC